MNSLLMLTLVLQIAMMIGGLLFLFKAHHVIVPESVWWAFFINDLLWIVLIADGMAQLSGFSMIGGEAVVLITFAISSLFLYRLVMRYRAHKQRLLLNGALLKMERDLERLRERDEATHGHNWDDLIRFGYDVGQSVYHVNRSLEVKHDQ